jgi:hypothetical protein
MKIRVVSISVISTGGWIRRTQYIPQFTGDVRSFSQQNEGCKAFLIVKTKRWGEYEPILENWMTEQAKAIGSGPVTGTCPKVLADLAHLTETKMGPFSRYPFPLFYSSSRVIANSVMSVTVSRYWMDMAP